jgi:hypothetical protein
MKIDASKFPYDEFDLFIDLGISVYKKVGMAWDVASGCERGQDIPDVVGPATVDDNEKPIAEEFACGAVEDIVIIPGFLHKKLVMSTKENFSGKVIGWKLMHCTIQVRRQHAYVTHNILWPLFPLHICAILALVLPIEEFGHRSTILFAVAFLEIGLRLSLDNRLPEVAGSILIQRMVNALFYTLLILAMESGILYFVLVRILAICDETPEPGDSCEDSDRDRRARVAAHVIDGVFALGALCPLGWVAWKMYKANRKFNVFLKDVNVEKKRKEDEEEKRKRKEQRRRIRWMRREGEG